MTSSSLLGQFSISIQANGVRKKNPGCIILVCFYWVCILHFADWFLLIELGKICLPANCTIIITIIIIIIILWLLKSTLSCKIWITQKVSILLPIQCLAFSSVFEWLLREADRQFQWSSLEVWGFNPENYSHGKNPGRRLRTVLLYWLQYCHRSLKSQAFINQPFSYHIRNHFSTVRDTRNLVSALRFLQLYELIDWWMLSFQKT